MRRVVVLALAACGQMYRSDAPPTEPLPAARPVEEGTRGEGTQSSASSQAASSASPASPAGASPAGAGQAAAPGTAKAGSVAARWVDAHNRYRAKHCAPPLTWSPELAKVAQAWADTLATKGCVFGHSPGATYGENLAAGTAGALDPESTVRMWYDEVATYKFPDGGFSMETGHFTQVVWKSTRQVGCGHVTCKGNDIYVCNYDPPGNWQGRYRQEVLPASCKK